MLILSNKENKCMIFPKNHTPKHAMITVQNGYDFTSTCLFVMILFLTYMYEISHFFISMTY